MIEPALLEVETSPRDSLVWDDWRSQLRHSIKTIAELRQWINVTPAEEEAVQACSGKYRWSITPYYASLMDPDDPNCPIRRQAVPSPLELLPFPTASIDPVGDMDHRKTRRVVHKYPDRVIMLVTDACPVYCRHCTRKYHTTDLQGTYLGERAGPDWEKDFEYIEQTPQIRDVLLTGGDPLTLGDNTLAWIIRRLRQIPHVEIVRIGTRYPVLLP
jgi:lysine 2,3-aminomutase